VALDDEHEVIDSPAALFRHLVEAHDLAEARELDPITTPVHPWLRRHAELERAARLAAARHREGVAPPAGPVLPDPAAAQPSSGPASPDLPAGRAAGPALAGREPRTPPPDPPVQRRERPDAGAFRDPLVEAVARGLGRRGHDERRVRAAIRAYVSPDGRRAGEDGVRAQLIAPLLDTLAAELTGATAQRPGRPREQPPPRPSPPPAAQDDVMALADAVQGRRGAHPARAGAAWPATEGNDDLLAIANALQRPRHQADRVPR
jgi:hypothetical protein